MRISDWSSDVCSSDLLAGKPVLGSPKEIQEVRNAFAAYEAMEHWQPHRSGDLLQAHGLLMAGLVDRPGRPRDGDVGIWRGNNRLPMATPVGPAPRRDKDLLGRFRRPSARPRSAP